MTLPTRRLILIFLVIKSFNFIFASDSVNSIKVSRKSSFSKKVVIQDKSHHRFGEHFEPIVFPERHQYETIETIEQPKEASKPRIVTDLQVIYGAHGVPVQYSYNESTSPTDINLGSVPGCPKSIDGFPWIYYGQPARCFLSGHVGPCGLGEILLPRAGSLFGICACECLHEDENSHLLNSSDRYLFCEKPGIETAPYGQIFDAELMKCYGAFQENLEVCGEQGTVIARWTNDSISCLPVCMRSREQERGTCTRLPITFKTFGGTILRHADCPPLHRYSQILKRCVKKFRPVKLFIG